MTDAELVPYTYDEAAKLGRVSVEKIGRLVKDRTLRKVAGSKGLLTRRSVQAWLTGEYDAIDGETEGSGDDRPGQADAHVNGRMTATDGV
jgi:excisionase family DNA binding protein